MEKNDACQAVKKEANPMLQNLLRTIDIITILLAAAAAYSMIVLETALVNSLLIAAAPVLLLIAKYKGSKLLLFFAYMCTTLYFTAVLYDTFSEGAERYFTSGWPAVLLAAAALIISIAAAIIGFGTNTLTILWFMLHLLVIRQTLVLYVPSSFFSHFWARETADMAITRGYPVLLMAVWLGLFLDKYQRELRRERLIR